MLRGTSAHDARASVRHDPAVKGASPDAAIKLQASVFELQVINLNSVDLGCVLCGTYCLVWQTEGTTEKWGG